MLNTVKQYIKELPTDTFDDFYQKYICFVQDINIQAEINSINSDEILSVTKLISKLKNRA